MPISTRDMACHTWALGGNSGSAAVLHTNYEKVTMEEGTKYNFGDGLRPRNLSRARQEVMERIVEELAEDRQTMLNHEVYICGGFRNGQVAPEHLWIEDHTSNKTYDTFIEQPVRVKAGVGTPDRPFRPPCEESPFRGSEIKRVRKDGYTYGQWDSLPHR